eukprot:TRINITY_DN41953_c0_g1_i1.p1 TRINITY_DN41953_c0_g1~~TRINITY_DN41953_c0_g1_i1.p1  ORF type:complete len:570 (-),score=66.62 TRINITY_DN41953_c0_g1_i1:123-1790(-)
MVDSTVSHALGHTARFTQRCLRTQGLTSCSQRCCNVKQRRFCRCLARSLYFWHSFECFLSLLHRCSAVSASADASVIESARLAAWRSMLAPAPSYQPQTWPRCTGAEQRANVCNHKTLNEKLEPDELDCVLACAPTEPALEPFVREYWLSQGLPGATEAALDYCDDSAPPSTVLFSIRGGRLAHVRPCSTTYDAANMHQMFTLLHDLAEATWLPDVDIILAFGDVPQWDLHRLFGKVMPVGTMTRSDSLITVPWVNPYFLSWTFGGEEPARVAWDLRERKAFFVGSLSLGVSTPSESWTPFAFSLCPRVRLLRIAATRPDLFHVRITSFDFQHIQKGMDPASYQALRAALTSHELVDTDEVVDFNAVAPHFRYVLNVPGVVASWNILRIMRTGSVMLLVRHITEEHVFPLMEPWKHYVPVAQDLSDLVPIVERLRADDELARSIGEAGQRLASERMAEEDTYCYLHRAISAIRNITGSPEAREPTNGRVFTKPHRHLGTPHSTRDSLDGYVPLKTQIARGHVRGCQRQQRVSEAMGGHPTFGSGHELLTEDRQEV